MHYQRSRWQVWNPRNSPQTANPALSIITRGALIATVMFEIRVRSTARFIGRSWSNEHVAFPRPSYKTPPFIVSLVLARQINPQSFEEILETLVSWLSWPSPPLSVRLGALGMDLFLKWAVSIYPGDSQLGFRVLCFRFVGPLLRTLGALDRGDWELVGLFLLVLPLRRASMISLWRWGPFLWLVCDGRGVGGEKSLIWSLFLFSYFGKRMWSLMQ